MSYGLEFSRNGERWLRVPETLRSTGKRYLERYSRCAIEAEARHASEMWRTPHVRIVDLDAGSAPVIIPAETLQTEEEIAGSHQWLAVPMVFVLAALLTIVGANAL